MTRAAVLVVVVAACGRIGFATTGDGATTGDAGPGCKASYQLCDGFEGASFAAVWTSSAGASIDTTVAHRGLSSAHFRVGAVGVGQDALAQIAQRQTLPLGDPTFHVRAWIRLAALPLDNMELITATQVTATPNELGLFVVPDSLAVYSQFSGQSANTPGPPPIGAWFCALWTVTRATSPAGRIDLAGDFAASLQNVRTDAAAPITEMDLGIGFSGSTLTVPQPPIDVWIDDLIVAASPMSCAD